MNKGRNEVLVGSRMLLLFSFVIPLLLILIIEWMHRGGFFQAVGWIVQHPIESFFNFVIAFAMLNILLLFANGKVYFVLSGFLGAILSMLAYVSHVKVDLRGEPLTILDVRLVGEAAAILEAFDAKYYIPVFVLGFVWILGFAFILWFVKPKVNNWMPFYMTALLSAVLLVYAHHMDIGALSRHNVVVPADVSWNHDRNGFLLATLVDSKFLKVPVPEDYGREAVKEVYERMMAAKGDDEMKQKPNVIFILGEAFWDLEKYTGLTFSEEPIPFFKQLSQKTLSGTIEVPGIGGGTANSEYEVLTGLSGDFIENYSSPYNPYSSYIHRPIQSLSRIFSVKGYETAGFHSYHGWFYRRSEVYKHLGFGKFVSIEHFPKEPERAGVFAKDKELYQLIINEVTRSPERNFISAITMQGHGPYHNIGLPDKTITLETKLSESGRAVIENYANVMKGVDSHFEQLIQFFESFEEPTVIVFYADHIPSLGSDVYRELNFNIYGEEGKRVPFLIWCNYLDLSGNVEMDAAMLGAYVLDVIGLRDHPYMNYMTLYHQKTPYIDKEADEAMYRDFALLHYDMMHGEQYIQQFVGELSANEDYALGNPIHIEDVIVTERKNMYLLDVMGSGISWMSALQVNHEEWNPIYRSSNRITAMIPKEELALNKDTRLQVKIKDSRNKIVKVSNEFHFTVADISQENNKLDGGWTTVKLGESLAWEFFDTRNNVDIVRVNLQLDDTPFYFVENEKRILTDANADTMERANSSDMYANGYLYLSISRDDSQWKRTPGNDEIKAYFADNEYVLHLGKTQTKKELQSP